MNIVGTLLYITIRTIFWTSTEDLFVLCLALEESDDEMCESVCVRVRKSVSVGRGSLEV